MERFYRYGLTGLLCLVAGAQFLQVITRYLLEVPVMGLEETMLYPTLWLYMMGAVNASRDNSHIRANVLEIFIKTERGHTLLAFIGEWVSIVVLLWLNYWAWDFITYSWRVWKESPTLYLPIFFADIALFIGLAAMTLYTLKHLFNHGAALMGGRNND